MDEQNSNNLQPQTPVPQPAVSPSPVVQPDITANKDITNTPPSSSLSKIVLIVVAVIVVIAVGAGALILIGKFQPGVNPATTKNNTSGSIPNNAENATANTQGQSTGVKYQDKPINPETLTPYTKEQLQALQVMELPAGFSIQEEYKGVKLVKSPKKSFTDLQIKLLHWFIDSTPKKLLTPGPAAIATFEEGEIDPGFMPHGVVAFASGPYIFFTDKSFNQQGFLIDNDMDKVFYAFEHELTHIAQFQTAIGDLTETDLNESLKQNRYLRFIEYKNPLFSDFAAIAGWKNTGTHGTVVYELQDKDTAQTTDYGKTEIEEDMAETIANQIMAKDYVLSPQRQQWALNFLGEKAESLKQNKFPFSTLFEETKLLSFNNYDTKKEEDFQARYQIWDKQTFFSEKSALEEIKNFLSQELVNRGWTGSFTQSSGRYKGEFIGTKRDVYIELINDNRYKGTIVIVINGYKL